MLTGPTKCKDKDETSKLSMKSTQSYLHKHEQLWKQSSEVARQKSNMLASHGLSKQAIKTWSKLSQKTNMWIRTQTTEEGNNVREMGGQLPARLLRQHTGPEMHNSARQSANNPTSQGVIFLIHWLVMLKSLKSIFLSQCWSPNLKDIGL